MTESIVVGRTLLRFEVLNSSVNGNPRYRVFFVDRPTRGYITMSDAAFVYQLGNPGWRVGSRVWVAYTRAGRIRHMESAS